MSVLSKLGPTATHFTPKFLCNELAKGRISLRAPTLQIGQGGVSALIVRHGHGHVMRRRYGQMVWNKTKDCWHFYILGIGVYPAFLILFLTHVYYGPCELTEYPKEGEQPPRHWQFERTPLRQFWSKWVTYPDMRYHESNLAFFARCEIKNRWRRLQRRVEHLQGEYQDYKGYYYHPLTNDWVELGKRRAAQFSHYHQHKVHTSIQDI